MNDVWIKSDRERWLLLFLFTSLRFLFSNGIFYIYLSIYSLLTCIISKRSSKYASNMVKFELNKYLLACVYAVVFCLFSFTSISWHIYEIERLNNEFLAVSFDDFHDLFWSDFMSDYFIFFFTSVSWTIQPSI